MAYHIERSEVENIIAATFGGYAGKKVAIVACETMTLTGLNWDGGSRSEYAACSLVTNEGVVMSALNRPAPWENKAEGMKLVLADGFCVVKHRIARGKDLGLTIYVHPDNMPKGLENSGGDLTDIEKLILVYTKTRKGRDRYTMAVEDIEFGVCASKWNSKTPPTRGAWDSGVEKLQEKKLLNKAKAITTTGKNAVS